MTTFAGHRQRVLGVLAATFALASTAAAYEGTGVVNGGTITGRVRVAGDVKLRVRPSAYWVTDPPLCVETTDDDWIVIRNAQPGRVQVFIDESDLVSTEDPCVTPSG